MKSFFYCCIFIFFLSTTALGNTTEDSIGIVKSVRGKTSIIRKDVAEPAYPGLSLMVNDIIQTGSQSAIGVILKDDTTISLGPATTLEIDQFMFSPNQGKLSIVTRMFRGTVVYLSGIIAKLSPDSVVFLTPDGSLGVRGTKFLVEVKI